MVDIEFFHSFLALNTRWINGDDVFMMISSTISSTISTKISSMICTTVSSVEWEKRQFCRAQRKTFCVNEILAYKLYSTPLLELPNLQLSPERRIPRNYRHADFASTRFWLCSNSLVRTVWFEQSCFELFDSNYLTQTVWFELFGAQATIRRSEDSEHSLRTPNLGIPSAQSVQSLYIGWLICTIFGGYITRGTLRQNANLENPIWTFQFRGSKLELPISSNRTVPSLLLSYLNKN